MDHRASPTKAELVALAIAACGIGVFGGWGIATKAPSTVGYVATVLITIGAIGVFRRRPLPGGLAIALALDSCAHLAGGLVRIGHDVLYNAAFRPQIAFGGTRAIQYDHFVHAAGTCLAALTLFAILVPDVRSDDRRRWIVLAVFGGMGIGAVNEVAEFILTLAHHGAHVGGYANTGWDLISNTVGATIAGIYLMRSA